MSSIPLPALTIRPAENYDPIGQYAKAVALKSAVENQQQQQQLRPLQLQQEQQAVQSQQLQIQSAQDQRNAQLALQQAMIANPTGSTDDWSKAALRQPGVLPGHVAPIAKALTEQQEATAKLRGTNLENADKQNTVIGQQSQMLLGIQDPNQRQQVYETQTVPALIQAGFPKEQISQQVPDDLTLKSHAAAAMSASAQLDEARKQQQFEQEHGILPPDKLAQINQALSARYQVLNPGKQLPSTYQLPANATVDDFSRVDKLMEQTEKASATQAQRETANGFRAQAAALANLAAQEKVAQLNKPTAQEQNRADLAQNLQENIQNLGDILKRRPDLFGPLAGRVTGLRQFVGTSDPDIAQLDAIKHQLGMAQISAHGMRSAQGIEGAAQSLINSFHNSPEATQAALDAATKSVATFQQQEAAARSGARTGITPNMVPGAKPKAQQPKQNDPLGIL